MTGKADFTDEEWKLVLEGPPSAGLLVITADRGGSIRETFSMAKAYTEARKGHGESELLDALTAAKPETDHTRYQTEDELKEACLKHLTDSVDVLKSKATGEELDQYKQFVLGLVQRVAEARKEGFMGLSGERVSEAEKAAIGEISAALA